VSNEASGWFEESNREASPSAKFKVVGDSVKGEIVDLYKIDYVPYAQKEPAVDPRTGQTIKQLVIVLQTELRNWEGVSRVPSDQDGNALPVASDKGRRAVYARKGTNIYSALGKAIVAAGAKDPEIGGKVGVQFFEEEDTGKGNPLKKYRAKYEAPVAKAGDFFAGDEPVSNPVVDDTPPF
jgi:hypothetical protein